MEKWDVRENTYQHESELTALCDFLTVQRTENIQVILEIGTYEGGTAYVWSQLAQKKVICVDLKFKDPIYRMIKTAVPILEIEGDSQNPDTRKKVKKVLGEDEICLLYIDGDHYYGSCREDYMLYSPLVRDGGWIAFHDIVNDRTQTPWFWNEIKGQHAYYEFVYNRQLPEEKRTKIDPNELLGLGLIRWFGRRSQI